MDDLVSLTLAQEPTCTAVQDLRACNAWTKPYGLCLSDAQIQNLLARHGEALQMTGRIEFGEGVLKKLIRAFSDSPYLWQENYEESLLELQDAFYYFKKESEDYFSDDELISLMKDVFNGVAQGSLDYLIGTTLPELCRLARRSFSL